MVATKAQIDAAMRRLKQAAQAHFEAVSELKRLGVVRSRSLVGDLGEQLAADYYGVALDPIERRGKGYDLIDQDGRKVEVKTLRCTEGNERSSIAPLTGDYDVLLAIRLNADYSPREAIEVPRDVVEAHYPKGSRVSWTKTLARADRVIQLNGQDLRVGRRAQA